MSIARIPAQELYHAISTDAGAFAMVAMDQRESLRTMFAEGTDEPVPDGRLIDFKIDVAHQLSPEASAFLIDTQWGLGPILKSSVLSDRCGLIVAADALIQERGQPVTGTNLDRTVDPRAMAEAGASALKLLIIWRPDEPPANRTELIGDFAEECHSAGLLALVEPVVRPPALGADSWDREEAILDAAREIGALGVDVYKAEVPYYGRGNAEAITERCRRLTEILPCPWVVLSQGVSVGDFPAAVEAACRGGASGFLAGRAIWSDILTAANRGEELKRVSVPRLRHLRHAVDRLARPWQEAIDR